MVSRWDADNNDNMYKKFGKGGTVEGVDCGGVVKWVKYDRLR